MKEKAKRLLLEHPGRVITLFMVLMGLLIGFRAVPEGLKYYHESGTFGIVDTELHIALFAALGFVTAILAYFWLFTWLGGLLEKLARRIEADNGATAKVLKVTGNILPIAGFSLWLYAMGAI